MNQAEAYGNSETITITADTRVDRHHAWCWVVTASGGGLAVQLPDATRLIPGYPVIQIVNDGATAFAIEDHGGTQLIASVAQDDVITFGLVENTDADGLWEWGSWTQDAGPPPTQLNYPWTLGGLDNGMDQEAWQYNFVTDAWSQLGGSIAENLTYPSSCRADTTGVGIAVNLATEAKSFDPDVWSDITDSSHNHSAGCDARQDDNTDRAYFYGSNRQDTGNVDAIEYYDVSGTSWTSASDMNSNRHKGRIGSDLDTLHFVMGGAVSALTFHDSVVNNDQYDVAGDTSSTKADMNTARQDFALAMSTFTGQVWCYCGLPRNAQPPFDDVESYDIVGDSWTVRTDFPEGDCSANSATRIDENLRIYIVGALGSANDDATNKHNPQSDTYTALTDHAAATGNARQHGTVNLSD